VLQIGEPVVVQNPSRVSRLAQLASCETLASLIHVPLSSKGSPLGTLCLGTFNPRSLADEEISLLSAIGSQIAVAVENARLYEELSRKEQLRRELLRRLISAQEDERKRIARELHDETSQTLTALLYAIDAATEMREQSKLPSCLDKMRRLTGSAIDGVHKLIFDLRPTMLDQLGLIAALRWYAETRLEEAGSRVEITETGNVQRLPFALETALFRTVQEAISNIARHAGARHVGIHFDFQEHQVEIRVEDDGIGFDLRQVSASSDPRCGLGLVSMEERMNAAGGEFFLTSVQGEGTTIVLRAALAGGHHGSDSDPGRG
jgi:signal transduction histidine kinase